AGLQPLPAAVADGGRDDGEDPAEGPVDAAGSGDELDSVLVELHAEPGPRRGAVQRLERIGLRRADVVGDEERAEGLAELARPNDVARPDLRPLREEIPGAQPLLELDRAAQPFAAVLEVGRVDELLAEPPR